MQALQEYHWPGNVRELEHVIERAVIISPGPVLRLADQLDREAAPVQDNGSKQLEAVEREHILKVLQETRWRIEGPGGAAVILGLNPSTLRFRIRRLGIERP
jgi:transcriptional regulator of acetoin/glycerol metabolism